MNTLRISLTALVLAVVLHLASAHAQELRQPTSLPRNDLRVVVMDFESPDSNYLGNTLARVFATELVSSLRDMGGVLARTTKSETERVSLNDAAPDEIGLAEKATLVVWGEYYFEGDTVTVVAHARLTPIPPQTVRDFSLVYSATDGELIARPLTEHVNFKSILLNRSILERLHAQFSAGIVLRAAPSESAASAGTFPGGQNGLFLSREPGWIQIRTGAGQLGWMQMTSELNSLTEIAGSPAGFVTGTALFAVGDYRAAENAFTSYLNTAGRSQDPVNGASARLLLGNTRLRVADVTKSLPKDESISAEFERAATLLPDDAAPAEHLAITRLLRYEGTPDAVRAEGLKASERDLIRTLQEDADSTHVSNMRTFYALATKRQFLKDASMSTDDYEAAVGGRNNILDQMDRYLILRTLWVPEEYGSIRYGFWTPAAEPGVTVKTPVNSSPASAITFSGITNEVRHSLDLHVRNKLWTAIFFDVAAGARYQGYTVVGIQGDNSVNPTVQSDIWAMVIPITIGGSFSPIYNFPVRPYIMAGIGGALGVGNRKPQYADGKRGALESEAQFTVAWNAGVAVDIFPMKRFALSLALKHESINFKEMLYSGQKDLSSTQFQIGLTFVP